MLKIKKIENAQSFMSRAQSLKFYVTSTIVESMKSKISNNAFFVWRSQKKYYLSFFFETVKSPIFRS